MDEFDSQDAEAAAGSLPDPSSSPVGSPFAAHWRQPRLGIIHLLAWTAFTAVLLKVSMGFNMFLDGAESPPLDPPAHVLEFIETTAHAAGLVGANLLLAGAWTAWGMLA